MLGEQFLPCFLIERKKAELFPINDISGAQFDQVFPRGYFHFLDQIVTTSVSTSLSSQSHSIYRQGKIFHGCLAVGVGTSTPYFC